MTLSWHIGALGIAVFSYQVASRLAYVAGVGLALRAEDRRKAFTGPLGIEPGFRRFRALASALMYNEAVAFVVLCALTRDTMSLGVPRVAEVAAGLLLAVFGTGVKFWAAAQLGHDAYYWKNFFTPNGTGTPSTSGPYRFLRNPMYTVGYVQTYGLALLLASWPGMIASVFAHAAIIIFHYTVEKPHFDGLDRASG